MKQIRINGLFTGLILLLLIGFSSCRDDDALPDSIPERDRAEQQAEDVDTLQSYFQSHYYNSGVFENSINPTIDDLIITKLEEGESVPDGHTLLMEDITTRTTVYLDVDYEYYFLMLNQGGGDDIPKFSDEVRVNFEGHLLDGTLFDSSSNSVVFDLTALVPGWGRVLPEFNAAEDFILNTDGTVTFNNAGVGVMFLPSGLAFFSSGTIDIPPYANLWFAFDLFQMQRQDHDGDGLPSFFEDIDDDLSLSNDDTDDNGLADFLDPNDDGDSVLTINELEPATYIVDTNMGEMEPILGPKEFEISRSEENGIITIETVKAVDTDNNGVDDYLDDGVEIDYSEED